MKLARRLNELCRVIPGAGWRKESGEVFSPDTSHPQGVRRIFEEAEDIEGFHAKHRSHTGH